jgi:hypothetical protein
MAEVAPHLSADPAQLRTEMRRTRERVDGLIDALQLRLRPAQLRHEARSRAVHEVRSLLASGMRLPVRHPVALALGLAGLAWTARSVLRRG